MEELVFISMKILILEKRINNDIIYSEKKNNKRNISFEK